MGGVSDYSGGTVLQLPLACAARVQVRRTDTGDFNLHSSQAEEAGLAAKVFLPVQVTFAGSRIRPAYDVRNAISLRAGSGWTAYLIGCVWALLDAGLLKPEQLTGLDILVSSDVPIGAGVSSSAAIEVACMNALCAAYGIHINGLQLALLCQRAENEIAGAPCGIMDQATSALGEENKLLVLKCQPCQVLGHQPIPSDWKFFAIDSGVKHSVGGSNYGRARVSAFIGFALMQDISEEDWGGYLCNVPFSDLESRVSHVPVNMAGEQFLKLGIPYSDTATTVDPAETYFPRDAAIHAVQENRRVREFLARMQQYEVDGDPKRLMQAGELMLAAHHSYSDRIHLGAEETDLLVQLAMEQGYDNGIYGAKITGGGSGGSVAILTSGQDAEEVVRTIAANYEEKTGNQARVLSGSSDGAIQRGVQEFH
jgi:L-arabinokinase